MELKAVLFDLWGTLIIDPDHRSTPRQAWRADNVRAVLERAGIALSFERVNEGVAAAAVALSAMHDECKDTSAQGRVDLVLSHLGIEAPLPPEARAELETAICTMHPVHKPEVADGAVELLRAAKESGLATGLVSNAGLTTAPNLLLMLGEFGLAPYLDACAFSDELLVAKPDARLFLEPLHHLGIEAPAAAFVGDSPTTNLRRPSGGATGGADRPSRCRPTDRLHRKRRRRRQRPHLASVPILRRGRRIRGPAESLTLIQSAASAILRRS